MDEIVKCILDTLGIGVTADTYLEILKKVNDTPYKYLEKAEIKGKKSNKVWYGYSTTPERFAEESVEYVMSDERDRNADISYSREVDGKIFTLKLDAGSERIKVYALEDGSKKDIGTIFTNIGFSDEFIKHCVLSCVIDYHKELMEKDKPDYEQKYWDCQRQIDQYEREREEFKKERESLTDKLLNEKEKHRKATERIESLQKALKEAEEREKEMPETLDINDGDKCWCVDGAGNICWTFYASTSPIDTNRVHKRRVFLSEVYAEEFAKKTQFIADCLHFKYLYDRDYEPDWGCTAPKYFIYYDNDGHKYGVSYSMISKYCSIVYFSTAEIAEKCAAWFNERID